MRRRRRRIRQRRWPTAEPEPERRRQRRGRRRRSAESPASARSRGTAVGDSPECPFIASRAARRDSGSAPVATGRARPSSCRRRGRGRGRCSRVDGRAWTCRSSRGRTSCRPPGRERRPPRSRRFSARVRGSGSLPNRSANGSSDREVESGMVRGAPRPRGRTFREVDRCSSRHREPAAAARRRRPDQQCYEIAAEIFPNRATPSAPTPC